jgi:hypothetical protein
VIDDAWARWHARSDECEISRAPTSWRPSARGRSAPPTHPMTACHLPRRQRRSDRSDLGLSATCSPLLPAGLQITAPAPDHRLSPCNCQPTLPGRRGSPQCPSQGQRLAWSPKHCWLCISSQEVSRRATILFSLRPEALHNPSFRLPGTQPTPERHGDMRSLSPVAREPGKEELHASALPAVWQVRTRS